MNGKSGITIPIIPIRPAAIPRGIHNTITNRKNIIFMGRVIKKAPV